ncbi:MAG: alpha-ketoacid dehydrogenase subunit beta [Thermodesulfobacteriota bacterium]
MPWTTPSIPRAEQETDAHFRVISYREAIREATWQLLEQDRRVFVMGEGVDDPGGVFGTTSGLWEKFGRERVMDTPLAENGMTGVALGAALAGMRPIHVHMRPDFLLLALDQLLNHAAKWRFMTGGRMCAPLVVRCIIGRGWGSAAQHSQSVQALLTHLPGLKVLMPATAYDAKGLLLAAVRDSDPVVILEHRWLFDTKGYVPEEDFEVEIGKARLCREGVDLSIVATSLMVHEAMAAADALAAQGIGAEVIDLRSIKPWDEEAVRASVRKTGRLLVCDTGHRHGGVGAEVVAVVMEHEFPRLAAPPRRIALPEAPVPAAASLEALYYPGRMEIIQGALELCGPR